MLKKWHFIIIFNLSFIFFFNSCGTQKVKVIPAYKFNIGEVLQYNLKMNLLINVDAGLFKYSGNIRLNADLIFKVVDKFDNLYKIEVDIKNPNIDGANSQILSIIYRNLNLIRSIISTIFLSSDGKITIVNTNYLDNSYTLFTKYILPEFTDFENLKNYYKFETNIISFVEEKKLLNKFSSEQQYFDIKDNNLILNNTINFLSYNYQDYYNSVEPENIGNITIDYKDVFNYDAGKFLKKNGNIKININFDNLSIKKGIFVFSYNLSIIGNGDFEILLINNYV